MKQKEAQAATDIQVNNMKLLKDIFEQWTAMVFMVLVVLSIGYTSFNHGYNAGYGNGVTTGLDTIYRIIDAQVKSDSTASHLTINDTIKFVLSRKTVLPK